MSWNARCGLASRDRCNDRRSCRYQAERTLRPRREWSETGPVRKNKTNVSFGDDNKSGLSTRALGDVRMYCQASFYVFFFLFCFAIHATLFKKTKNSCSPGSKPIKKRRIKNWTRHFLPNLHKHVQIWLWLPLDVNKWHCTGKWELNSSHRRTILCCRCGF